MFYNKLDLIKYCSKIKFNLVYNTQMSHDLEIGIISILSYTGMYRFKILKYMCMYYNVL